MKGTRSPAIMIATPTPSDPPPALIAPLVLFWEAPPVELGDALVAVAVAMKLFHAAIVADGYTNVDVVDTLPT